MSANKNVVGIIQDLIFIPNFKLCILWLENSLSIANSSHLCTSRVRISCYFFPYGSLQVMVEMKLQVPLVKSSCELAVIVMEHSHREKEGHSSSEDQESGLDRTVI